MGPIKQPNFSPYADNGGTVVAIAGSDYAIIASETRLSSGYQIYTRDQPKLFQITDKTILGITGCWCDALTFAKVIESRVKNYSYEHNRSISTTACAQLVSTMLYYKRFFPYYVSNIVAGIDEQGRGAVFEYDPVGSFGRYPCASSGSSNAIIQPLLDNKVAGVSSEAEFCTLSLDDSLKLVKDAFVSAGERDIYVGDHVEIRIVTAQGIQQQRFDLRKD